MLKAIHVYKSYAPTRGGIEGHIRQVAFGLRRMGIESTVLVTAPGRRTVVEEVDGVRVIRAGRIGELASTPLSYRLIEEVRRAEIDLIHLHLPYPIGELAYLLAGRERRLVVTYHSDVVRQWWARPIYLPFLRALLGRASAILATSPPYVASSPVLRPLAERCVVVPLAVDPARFTPPLEAVAAARARLLHPRYPALVLFVGRFRAYKGLPYLVEAMAGLPARLVLIGSGPAERTIRQAAERRGIAEQVVLLGDVADADLPTYYAASDVFALPSIQRSEAFGIVLLEAMASSRPVVSTELGTGTSWVNQTGVTGLVVPPRDVAALRQALATLLADRALAERLGRAARARVLAEFGEEQLLQRIATIYAGVIREAGR